MDNTVFELNAFYMRTIGIYKPNPEWNLLQKIGYYIRLLIWIVGLWGGLFFNLSGIIWCGEIEKISDIAINIVNIELFSSVIIRAGYFAKDNKKIDLIANQFMADYAFSTKLSFKTENMDFISKVTYFLIHGWMAFVFVAGTLMSISPLLRTPMELPFKIWAWYDLDNAFSYTLTVFAEFVAIQLMLFSHGNLDMLNAAFMLLTSGQVDILTTDFSNVIHDALKKNNCSEEEIMEYISYENDESVADQRLNQNEKIDMILTTHSYRRDALENLLNCVRRHQKLLEFIEEYSSFISPYLFVEVNFNFSYMIFMLFTFVTIDNSSMYAPMCMYVSGCIAQVFLMMYLGERLTNSVETLRDKFYDIPWYLCDLEFQTDFKIVQMRMSKIVSVSAGNLLAMTLDTFLEFMKKAFSFFTVLRQVN